jgi:hypothetical protein
VESLSRRLFDGLAGHTSTMEREVEELVQKFEPAPEPRA